MTKVKTSHFVISDLHLGHKGILKYCRQKFVDIKQHNTFIIECINSVVTSHDWLWILGDVAFTKTDLDYLRMLKTENLGLIGGNHDLYNAKLYSEYFKYIYGAATCFCPERKVSMILTHIPVHESELDGGRYQLNIHGHKHEWEIPDSRYINVCCEPMSYKPMKIDNLIQGHI